MRSRFAAGGGLIVVLALVVAVALTAANASTRPPRPDTAPGALPTLQTLHADLVAAVAAAQPPDLSTTVPPLASLQWADETVADMNWACFDASGWRFPFGAPRRCVFGDRAATRTILLVGDSQAAMWLAALDPVAQALGWRIVFVAHVSCPPWPGQAATVFDGSSNEECQRWDVDLLTLERQLRPQVVVPVGTVGTDGAGSLPTAAHLEAEQRRLVADVSPAHVVLLSPLPMYERPFTSYTPATCLTTSSDLQSCEYPPAALVDAALADAGRALARLGEARYVDVTRLFCTDARCALVVANHLVYYDSAHANRFYMAWVSGAFSALVAPDLRADARSR